MIIIVGKTASGKSTLAKEFERRGYKRIVTYTTRPMRPGEVDGVDYHFLSEKEFNQKKDAGFFMEYASYDASFGHCSYGSAKKDYKEDEKSVIVLNPLGLRMVQKNNPKILSAFLKCEDEEIRSRLEKRGDNPTEIQHRLDSDERDFADIRKITSMYIPQRSTFEQADIIEDICEMFKNMDAS